VSSVDRAALAAQLESGIRQLQLTLPDGGVNRLLNYLSLLHRWNRAYNLTAVREPAEMVTRHLLDSLAVVPFLEGKRFADVGTGAGLPGIPLAIALPHAHFTLVDSNGKKIRFVTQAIAELGLSNAVGLQQRVEAWRPSQPFDGVLSRAFTSLAEMAERCDQLLVPTGRFYALKGMRPVDELSELPKRYIVDACHALRVPGESGERHLVVIGRVQP
jgi:16S rRNA (guanine527-N7)-methyltransferase